MQESRKEQQPAKAREGKRRRERILRLRIHAADLVRWRAAAERGGVHSLSAWLRAAADQAAACGPDPLAWRRDLVSLQRRLNSILEGTLAGIPQGVAVPATDPVVPTQIAMEIGTLRREVRAVLLGRPLPRPARRPGRGEP